VTLQLSTFRVTPQAPGRTPLRGVGAEALLPLCRLRAFGTTKRSAREGGN
jgi:hypothetical protein